MINLNDSEEHLKVTLAYLISDKKKLTREIDNLDTQIIGIKEELRKRAEAKQLHSAVCNQFAEDDED